MRSDRATGNFEDLIELHVESPRNMARASRKVSSFRAREFPNDPPSGFALVDTHVIYCGDNIEQLAKLPDGCVDLVCLDQPFNSDAS
jgi:hypothetical protein